MNRAESSHTPKDSTNFDRLILLFSLLFLLPPSHLCAQNGDKPLLIFGYYQNAFEYNVSNVHPTTNTFLTQQLNIIAQKDLSPSFRSFVNLEFLNTYDGRLEWGSASLKEAWVRYDVNPKFKLKMGLHIPIFNYLNEIKTRTPLLPYVIRPIVYEESLGEIIALEEYIPERAFVQAYGTFPTEPVSFDYAVFLGNSQEINTDSNSGQTGVDTTSTILLGGRVGLLWNRPYGDLSEIKFGLSTSYDQVNIFTDLAGLIATDSLEQIRIAGDLKGIPRWRFGTDLAIYWKQFYLQSEFISVIYSEDTDFIDVDRFFVYATAGMWTSEKLEMYISYWRTNEIGFLRDSRANTSFRLDEKIHLDIYTVGAKYNITPRLVLKAQMALAEIGSTQRLQNSEGFSTNVNNTLSKERFAVFALALSVFF